MRNSRMQRMEPVFAVLTLATALLTAAGCADTATRDNLRAGYGALEAKQYDAAVQKADEQLTKVPQGPGSAEALYLKGRALEAKASPGGNSANPDADWQAARAAYVDALNLNPSPDLEAHIRAGVANVAYFQNDYTTALQQWSTAYDKIRDEETNAWILYRIGVCQQRLNQFDAADKTFATVQDKYKSTEAADRARTHSGFKNFNVQLTRWGAQQPADNAVMQLRKEGAPATRMTDPHCQSAVYVGPAATYQQALQLKAKYASRFPDAAIVP